MNFLSKLIFFLKKPKVIIVTGEGRACAVKAISQVLEQRFEIGKDVSIFEFADKDIKRASFFLKKSQKPIMIVTRVGDIPFDKNFFDGEKEKIKNTSLLAKALPEHTTLILNFDDETVREIGDEIDLDTLTFGFQKEADFKVSDVMMNGGTNFKLNYKGKIIPFWLKRVFGKEQIYSALTAIVVGTIFGLNLVEISQSLLGYRSLPGRMKLIKGIKNSWILNDSESATTFSMIEALQVLGELKDYKRKIAVLGDVIGVGKYTIEAHETIGEKVVKNADLLFTFGARARFIAKEAQLKGMALEKVFQFDRVEEGKLKLQDEIKEGDIILIDGSQEMKMEKIVEEIRFQEKSMAPSSSG